MNVKIKIDSREKDLIKKIMDEKSKNEKYKEIEIETGNLLIGDIHILLNEKEKILIERKTVSDLFASIKDGRYEEQSFRLQENEIHNHNIVYLIEGNVKKDNQQIYFSSIFSFFYFKGFSIMRTNHIDESVFYILNSSMKLYKDTKKGKIGYYIDKMENEETETKKDYIEVVKKSKSDHITKENINEVMLCQIPGISRMTAKVLMDKYIDIFQLVEEIRKNKDCLKELFILTETKKRKKINKNTASIICEYLMKQKEIEIEENVIN
jgi:ERCC4-type nuclease